MKKICYLIVIILLFSCKTDNKTNSNTLENNKVIKNDNIDEKFVIAKFGLNYRKKPKGEIIGKFEYSEKIQIIEYSNIFETINDNGDDKKGEWLGVKVNNDTVYVFSSYLSNDIVKKPIKSQTKQGLTEILLPFTYRDWENKNPTDNLNTSWVELDQKEDKYYINKANYIIERGEDACTGDSTKTIVPKNKTLLFIKNSNLEIGEIHATYFEKNKIWPNEKVSFNYKNIIYTIRAEGDIISTEEVHTENGLERYSEVENYKLYISTNKKSESLFLEQKSFNDTFVKLLFVGDIDLDGNLDFIFETNRDYEDERVFLYLSSETNESEIIKKVAEISVGFDC